MHPVRWPEPLPAGIEVHRLDLDIEAEPVAARALLTPAERARADRFARVADRARFTLARAALRRLLAERLDRAPAGLPIAADAHGKPFLDLPGEMPPFNVSHSGAHALIAIGDPRRVRALGIDIEACRAGIDAEAIAATAFTEREHRSWRDAGCGLQALYAHWAAKEAVLKAIGVGMAEHLKSIDLRIDAGGRIGLECAVPAWTRFQAMTLAAPPGHAAALAWQAKEAP